jgi:hypothetical protein
MGHINQRHQNIRFTSKAPIEKQPTPDTDSGTKTHLVYAVVVDQGQLYTDLTGKLPVRSSWAPTSKGFTSPHSIGGEFEGAAF